jgi:hypothetical protein
MTQPAPGTRFRKTIESEVLPPRIDVANDAQAGRFYNRPWEDVVNDLTAEQWSEHLVRVYRAGEKWERGAAPVDNVFNGPFTEEDIRSRFGGGKFILWMLGPPKKHNLVAKWQVDLEGVPLVNSVPRTAQADGTNSVALEAMRMYANPEFMRMQMQMMMTAATQAMELIKTQIPPTQDPLATLRNAKEILGSGNQEHGLLDTIRALKELGLIGSPEKKGVEEILALITTLKTSGLITSGAPKADLAATFANNLPMLVDRLVNGLHEFRLNSEAQERTVRLQRGEIRPGDPNVIDVTPSSPTPAAAAGNTAATPASTVGTAVSAETAQAIIAQAHMHRLVAGIKDPESDGQDMYDYLRNAWPEILDELTKFSKEQLLAFFKSREHQMQYFGSGDILTQVADDPRLPKIIEDFLRIAKEAAAAETKSAAASAGVV